MLGRSQLVHWLVHSGAELPCLNEKVLPALLSAAGLLVPDLPDEQLPQLQAAAAAHELELVLLVTPATPTTEEVQRLARSSKGFVYLASVAGATGKRHELVGDSLWSLRRFPHRTQLSFSSALPLSYPRPPQCAPVNRPHRYAAKCGVLSCQAHSEAARLDRHARLCRLWRVGARAGRRVGLC